MSVEMKDEIRKFKIRMILNLILVRSVTDCVAKLLWHLET